MDLYQKSNHLIMHEKIQGCTIENAATELNVKINDLLIFFTRLSVASKKPYFLKSFQALKPDEVRDLPLVPPFKQYKGLKFVPFETIHDQILASTTHTKAAMYLDTRDEALLVYLARLHYQGKALSYSFLRSLSKEEARQKISCYSEIIETPPRKPTDYSIRDIHYLFRSNPTVWKSLLVYSLGLFFHPTDQYLKRLGLTFYDLIAWEPEELRDYLYLNERAFHYDKNTQVWPVEITQVTFKNWQLVKPFFKKEVSPQVPADPYYGIDVELINELLSERRP